MSKIDAWMLKKIRNAGQIMANDPHLNDDTNGLANAHYDNTTVSVWMSRGYGTAVRCIAVQLHDNVIAEFLQIRTGSTVSFKLSVSPRADCTGGVVSNTTKSRLNAILGFVGSDYRYSRRNKKTYLANSSMGNYVQDDTEFVVVPDADLSFMQQE